MCNQYLLLKNQIKEIFLEFYTKLQHIISQHIPVGITLNNCNYNICVTNTFYFIIRLKKYFLKFILIRTSTGKGIRFIVLYPPKCSHNLPSLAGPYTRKQVCVTWPAMNHRCLVCRKCVFYFPYGKVCV